MTVSRILGMVRCSSKFSLKVKVVDRVTVIGGKIRGRKRNNFDAATLAEAALLMNSTINVADDEFYVLTWSVGATSSEGFSS